MADGSDVDYEYEVNQSRVRASKRRYAEQRRGARAGTQVEGDGSDGSAGQFEKEMMGEDFTMREIEDSLDRTIRHTEEMHRAGAETAATLHRQGDQLRVAVEDLADQEEHMNRAQYYLSLLEQSCCWQLFCCCCCCCEPEYKRGRLIRRGGRGRDEDPLGEPLIAEIRMEGKKKGKQSVARARAKRGVERPASEEDRHSLKVDRVYELTEEEKVRPARGQFWWRAKVPCLLKLCRIAFAYFPFFMFFAFVLPRRARGLFLHFYGPALVDALVDTLVCTGLT